MIQGVDEGWVEKSQLQVDGGIRRDTCSVETGNSNSKSWHVGAAHRFVPYEHRKKVNRFENLTDGADSEHEEESEET
eukprot:11329539-Karenia_brevis.AAC.1